MNTLNLETHKLHNYGVVVKHTKLLSLVNNSAANIISGFNNNYEVDLFIKRVVDYNEFLLLLDSINEYDGFSDFYDKYKILIPEDLFELRPDILGTTALEVYQNTDKILTSLNIIVADGY